MPAVSRLGDRCTGHDCFPPRESVSASTDVFVNGIGAHRQGDSWATHCCRKSLFGGRSCHNSNLASGSSTVYVNGRQLSRIGDPVACGSIVAQGSSDVFAGG
jgi:uncharacterized Zn-binding protein involved in type VI secretion